MSKFFNDFFFGKSLDETKKINHTNNPPATKPPTKKKADIPLNAQYLLAQIEHWRNSYLDTSGDKLQVLEENERLNAKVKELEHALEEREADMHMRIRLGYDTTVADSWRAYCAVIQQERDTALEELEKLKSKLDKIEDKLWGPL